ncbi:predicted protein [Histoplasma mississippiense (nom. inval.)]|uniref:predicted protein n=1 Tax=Ajellomyces capsulatus (strain NAm1 / WU24) TaxID=2059318 RepID=UPI000157B67D|nr:predicted protein [Histoplasma mississippiense (nom. inval.)]EDN02926.1 predicted protein [Histoplasma mississippiense (nom. inval.)]
MHKTQVATGSVDLTWVFTQSVFMALNTVLWSLSYPSIRQEHTIDEVKGYIAVALDIIITKYQQPTQPMEPVVTTSYSPPAANSGDPAFDPNSLYNHFPSVLPGLQHWDPNYTAASTTAGYLSYSNANVDPLFWLGSIGDQYSQFFNQQYPTDVRGRSLTQEEHMELMANLVQNPPDASCRSNEPMAYYSCDMP